MKVAIGREKKKHAGTSPPLNKRVLFECFLLNFLLVFTRGANRCGQCCKSVTHNKKLSYAAAEQRNQTQNLLPLAALTCQKEIISGSMFR